MALTQKAAAIAVAGVLPLVAAACSASAGSSTGSPASATVAATSASSSANDSADGSSGGSGSGPLASLSAEQIASKATADFKAASSVHAAGTISGEKINLTIARGKCAGTIDTSAGPLKLIQIGSALWISTGGSSQYLKTSAGKSQYEGMVGFCTFGAIAQDFSMAGAALTKGPVTEVAGQRAITLTVQGATDKSYVSDTGTPEYLRTDQPGVNLDFSGYNARVSITAPPPSDVIGG